MSRFAQSQAVYFVEEPVREHGPSRPALRVHSADNVTVLTPVLQAERHHRDGFNSDNNPAIGELLDSYFAAEFSSTSIVAWYYTPMAFGALPASLTPTVTVFDAMDELANFRHAPVELRDRDLELMQAADLVFSGGPSLYDLRKNRHPRAFCYPSGVDEAHFKNVTGNPPVDIADIETPIIGFYGVLDERIDFDLIAGIADLRSDWTVLLIGPVVKINESELAVRPNIRYLGMRTYDQLPGYLGRFDAAILPFAINDATRFISPTKTLEYLAGGKPVVSTPIHDVVHLYGSVTEIARTPEEFVSSIEQRWSETPAESVFREHLIRNVLAEHGWDTIASGMESLVQQVLEARSMPESMIHDAVFTSTVRYPAATAGAGE